MSGMLVMLSSANIPHTYLKYGTYSGFNEKWFENVGTIIVRSFVILCLFPIFELFMTIGFDFVYKAID